jgi:hypothetical protein
MMIGIVSFMFPVQGQGVIKPIACRPVLGQHDAHPGQSLSQQQQQQQPIGYQQPAAATAAAGDVIIWRVQ